MPLYDSLRDIANQIVGANSRHAEGLAGPQAYRVGDTSISGVSRENPEHNDFLYASLNRPVGGLWLDLEAGYTILGGTRRSGIIGTSEPLGIGPLNSYELRPYDQKTRAETILREWDRDEEGLAAAEGERGTIEKAEFLVQIEEHEGDWSRVIYDENGPIGHMEYNEVSVGPSSSVASLRRGVVDLLEGDKEMIPFSIARDQMQRWLDQLPDLKGLAVPS